MTFETALVIDGVSVVGPSKAPVQMLADQT